MFQPLAWILFNAEELDLLDPKISDDFLLDKLS